MTLEDFGHVAPEMDLHPDIYPYEDKGCELEPSCLNCPRPTCALDEKDGIAGALREWRDSSICYHAWQGKTTQELADVFDLSQRTVQRVLQNKRNNNAESKRASS